MRMLALVPLVLGLLLARLVGLGREMLGLGLVCTWCTRGPRTWGAFPRHCSGGWAQEGAHKH